MEEIIQLIHANNWNKLIKSIKKIGIENIEWDLSLDNLNPLLHYLAYRQIDQMIELIDIIADDVIDLSDKLNAEGDNLAHIFSKTNQTDLFLSIIKINDKLLFHRNNSGIAPLNYLIGNTSAIKHIVSKTNIRDHLINSATGFLEYYIEINDTEMLGYLLDKVEITDVTYNCIKAIIRSDTIEDYVEYFDKFYNLGLDINYLDTDYLNAIIYAIVNTNIPAVEYLIKNNIDVNYSGPDGNHHLIKLILMNKNIESDEKNTLIKLLLDHNIDVNFRDKDFRICAHYIFDSDYNSGIEVDTKHRILSATNSVNIRDSNLDTPMHFILTENWINYSDVLEDTKINIHRVNRQGVKPIDLITNADIFDKFIDLVYRSYINQLDSEKKYLDSVDNTVAIILDNGKSIETYRQYIYQKIIKCISFPQVQRSMPDINIIVAPKTNITHFSAYTYNYIIFLLYILEKYPQIKIPELHTDHHKLMDLYLEITEDFRSDHPTDIIFRSIIKDYINHAHQLINHLIIWGSDEKYYISPYIIQGIDQVLKTYPDTKYILLKLTLISSDTFNHANIIIYDVEKQIFERFDPYGNVAFIDSPRIDNLLRNFVSDYFPQCTYLSPADTSKGISFQIFSDETNDKNYVENDPTGFCIAWCIWYVETRIKNFDVKPSKLIKYVIEEINKNADHTKDYIRNYANYIDSEKNNILSECGLSKKYWYKHTIPTDLYKTYIKNIRLKYRQLL